MNSSYFFKTLAALFFFILVGKVYAESLDENDARFAAAQFFSPSSSSTRLRAKGLQLILRSNGHEKGYYIFDRPEGGTVFVADDDAIGRAVLGFTDDGSFDSGDIPPGLQDWLRQVGVLMNAVHEGKIKRKNVQNKAREIVVDELIKTKWHQRSPYNSLCPMYNSKRCVTGCVATAMAQVMKYWKWPEHGYGSKTYTDTEGCGQTLSQDFSSSYYDWDQMLDTYTAGNYTAAQSEAVATLMRDCGYAVEMIYTPTASSAHVSPIDLTKHFHYSTAAKERLSYVYSEEKWHEFIRQDLLAKRPVLYGGQGAEGGHQFILDGFDTSGFYHVNWGWGDDKDGWYIMTNFQGFNDDQTMINELEPDYGENGFSYNISGSVLTINGSGPIPQSYDIDNAPWKNQRSNINKIVIGEGITAIPSYFAYGYETSCQFANLNELVLPEGLTSIGDGAFQKSTLTSVWLPSTLISMDNAFWASNLKSLHLSKSLIGYTDYLPYLEKLTIDDENPNLRVEDNVLYSKDCKNLVFAPAGLSCITVAETTENVCDYNLLCLRTPIVFKGKTAPSISPFVLNYPYNLVDVCGCLFIPLGSTGYESWKKILPSYGWTVLNYADINYLPDTKITWSLAGGTLTISGWGIQKYEKYGYSNAPYRASISSITKLVVEEGVNILCKKAFSSYNKMKRAVLPSTLKYIDGECFKGTGLTEITSYARTAPKLGEDVFYSLPTSGVLRVPEGANYSSWLNALPSGWQVQYFTPEPLATCYLYTGEQQQVGDLQAWNKLLQQYPNAIAILNAKDKEWAYLTCNMLIKDTSTDRYRCPYLQLTDLTNGFSASDKMPKTGFLPPVSFDVSNGMYERKLNFGYNTSCLPVTVRAEDMPTGSKMYTYSHFDADKGDVIFVPQTSVEAGCPFFVYSEAIANWQADLSGETIVTQPTLNANGNVGGTFVTTAEYKDIGYSPRLRDNIFAPLAQNLYPFRACILLGNSDAPAEVRVRLMDADESDQLKDIMAKPDANSRGIYSLDGKRLFTPIKGQPYIENGKIMIR